ncbi:MAG TPA: helix-turn-helix transcriptional regulator [Gemmataceae bacterium]|nr:helix-turn-helix transcriptional regulator [Gemmataceae bacterium]
MNGQIMPSLEDLAAKIARMVEERGWNQEEFARHTGLNRQTVRQILLRNGGRRLRNGTISRCAKALGLSVNELRSLPLERLLTRVNAITSADCDALLRRLYNSATQPELLAWLERNPERARQLSPEEIDELLSVQGTGGPLTRIGVERYVEIVERKRKLIQEVHVVAGTEYLELLEKFVGVLYEKVQPYRERIG